MYAENIFRCSALTEQQSQYYPREQEKKLLKKFRSVNPFSVDIHLATILSLLMKTWIH